MRFAGMLRFVAKYPNIADPELLDVNLTGPALTAAINYLEERITLHSGREKREKFFPNDRPNNVSIKYIVLFTFDVQLMHKWNKIKYFFYRKHEMVLIVAMQSIQL